MKTAIQRMFAPFKVMLPRAVWTRIRAAATAFLTPIVFSRSTGHFKSSLREKAVSRSGDPLPWYSYPCIDLLRHRDFSGRNVLEFGAGQSTLWWAKRADRVISIEGDPAWHSEIVGRMPSDVELHLVPVDTKEAHLAAVLQVLARTPGEKFDVIIIDADWREDLVAIAVEALKPGGAIICDDAESYRFYEETRDLPLSRVDFFGFSPGVVLPHCTSVYFKDRCFLFEAHHPIPDVGKEI